MANVIISEEVADVLRRSTISGNLLKLPGQLERSLYEEVNKVLVNLGGSWSKKQQGHLFASDPMAKLGIAMDTGVSIDEKKLYQAFYTPPELAARVVEVADVSGKLVLEPSAGHGALVKECLAQGASEVVAVELNPEACAHLGSEHPKVTLYSADFLKLNLKNGDFDRIVMNPPFTKNQDIKHVTKALTLLAEGGILVAVMAANTTRKSFAEMLHGYHDYDIENIPAGSFSESGTEVATIMLTVRKEARLR
jgi:predicted RNA methylase